MEVTPVKREKLYNLIIETIYPDKEMTAREIATDLYTQHLLVTPTRQEVAPRLCELMEQGRVEVCGSKVDEQTNKKVSIYRLVR
jgi:hypothetical protein